MTHTPHDNGTPAEGQQVITACAFIHQKIDGVEKVFLAKRADTKKFLPGVYELLCGHIEFGEDIVEGLAREVDEELGMEVTVGDPFSVFTYTDTENLSQTIEVVYFAHFSSGLERIKLNPEDHSGYGWFAEDELINAVTPDKGLDDDEFKAIKKGFKLLSDESLNFQ